MCKTHQIPFWELTLSGWDLPKLYADVCLYDTATYIAIGVVGTTVIQILVGRSAAGIGLAVI